MKIVAGVQRHDEEYVFDFDNDYPEDIIHLANKSVYSGKYKTHKYYFGYEFNPDISSKVRTQFINHIKQTNDGQKISDFTLRRFVEQPLNSLNDVVNLYDIDAFVYPISGRSKLVNEIIRAINSYTSRDLSRCSYNLVKSAPTDIEFDWDMFESEVGYDKPKYLQMSKYIKDVILPHIHDLDYFSLARDVKPKYRRYIKNYLNWSEDAAIELSKLKGDKILVVDDINTSGSTLDEILRKISEINKGCEIYIYTLIGNFK